MIRKIMSPKEDVPLLDSFITFGDLLKYLRRRAQITQRELGIAVGYSEAHISRLENNHLPPDLAGLVALFVPVLRLQEEPETLARLVELAGRARGDEVSRLNISLQRVTKHEIIQEVGALEGIPPPPSVEIYRSERLTALQQRLENERFLVLTGLPGVGKTALAASLAQAWTQRGPVFWMSFIPEGNISPEAIAHQLALFALDQGDESVSPILRREADSPSLSLDQQTKLLGNALNTPDSLLCFDETHFLSREPAAISWLARLISSTRAHVLLISRENLALAGFGHMVLTGLTAEELSDLVQRFGLQMDSLQRERLLLKTQGSPMLLRLVIGYLRDQQENPGTFIDHLEAQPQVTTFLLDSVLHELSAESWELLRLLAVLRRPIDLLDARIVEKVHAKLEEFSMRAALGELERRHLVNDPAYATLHPVIRDYVHAELTADPPKSKQIHQLASSLYDIPGGDIVEAGFHYLRAGELERVTEVLANQSEDIISRGLSDAALLVVDESLSQVRRMGETGAYMLRHLLSLRGELLVSTPSAEEAEIAFREAYALAQGPSLEAGPRLKLASNLANALLHRAKPTEVLDICKEIAKAATESGGLIGAQLAAHEGRAYLMLSKFEDAEKAARRSLDLTRGFETISPRQVFRIQSSALAILGIVQHLRRDHDQAVSSLREAISAARLAGSQQLEYRTLFNLANIYYDRGDFESARKSLEEVLSGFRSLGDSFSEARALNSLGSISYVLGELDAALENAGLSLHIKEQMGDTQGMIYAKNLKINALLAIGKIDDALDLARKVVSELGITQEPRAQATALDTLALAEIMAEQADAALASLERAENIPGATKDGRILSYLLNHRALAMICKGDLQAAEQTLSRELPAKGEPEIDLERELILAIMLLAKGDKNGCVEAAKLVGQHAEQLGYQLHVSFAQRLTKAPTSIPLASLPRQVFALD
jgi:ATP/maltotriose-dependent transcriptional regulator MalT/DNA-binding XRE family transcriptional regulator